ncbi:rod-binding protein [Fuscibacter oryzae]|uniref:Rod-binding protein n=1 Tax=Fuscibacter oryzae TaxID=2803939 RepID=A0A8J7MQN6_9RHOB|nr:rod-binding protein [Fuscibacter oryzae]MBL4928368.1 rod-binding protein [Fuscibacter oryzae]
MDISLSPAARLATPQDRALWAKAQELEATFLSEMLKDTGLGKSEGSFAGGIGEEQFGSFLRDEQAKLIVGRGGVGLAEQIFRSLRQGGAG